MIYLDCNFELLIVQIETQTEAKIEILLLQQDFLLQELAKMAIYTQTSQLTN